MKKQTKYWLHGSAGENLHFQTTDLYEGIRYANSFTSKCTVSIEKNGVSAFTGKPCKVFEVVYNNQSK